MIGCIVPCEGTARLSERTTSLCTDQRTHPLDVKMHMTLAFLLADGRNVAVADRLNLLENQGLSCTVLSRQR